MTARVAVAMSRLLLLKATAPQAYRGVSGDTVDYLHGLVYEVKDCISKYSRH